MAGGGGGGGNGTGIGEAPKRARFDAPGLNEKAALESRELEAIGRLVSGVAHDFNNLLSIILSYSDLILQDLTPGDPLYADVDQIKRAGQRAADLTQKLLALGKGGQRPARAGDQSGPQPEGAEPLLLVDGEVQVVQSGSRSSGA